MKNNLVFSQERKMWFAIFTVKNDVATIDKEIYATREHAEVTVDMLNANPAKTQTFLLSDGASTKESLTALLKTMQTPAIQEEPRVNKNDSFLSIFEQYKMISQDCAVFLITDNIPIFYSVPTAVVFHCFLHENQYRLFTCQDTQVVYLSLTGHAICKYEHNPYLETAQFLAQHHAKFLIDVEAHINQYGCSPSFQLTR